jgi:hypothetical protein
MIERGGVSMRMLAVLVVAVCGVIFNVGCGACNNCQNCRRCTDCRLEQPCATHRNLDEKSASEGIRIESARYGRDNVWVDVTPQVRSLVAGDTIVFPRDLQGTLHVDPVPGRMKTVEMTIILDGRVMEMSVGDNLNITPLRIRVGGAGGDGKGGATTREARAEQ